jgi:signal transduction histidine kinase
VQLAVLVVGVVVGLETSAIVRRSAGYSMAGASNLLVALELTAGWLLVGAGAVALLRPARRSFGIAVWLASVAWFVVEWNTPGIGSAWAFTVGVVFATVYPALVSDAVLRYADWRFGVVAVVVVWGAYVSTIGLAGLLPALFFHPAAGGCQECPANLLLIRADPQVVEQVSRAAVYAGVGWAAGLIGVLGWRLARSSAARRRAAAPVVVPALVFLGAVGLGYVHSWDRGYLGTDEVDRRLWAVEGVLLILIAVGTGWSYVRRRRTRSAVAKLVVDTSDVSVPGGLDRSLGAALGDDSLRVLYPLRDGWVDDAGRPVVPDDSRGMTRLTRGGAPIALLTHRRGVLDEDGVADEIAGAAALALDNERLQAQRRAQLADLRASRARIVAAADAERRRLERDLHDGAQQRLVALSLSIRLAQLRTGGDGDPGTSVRLDRAQAEVTAALAQLRSVARGLYPRELADEGLSAALQTLAEASSIPLIVDAPVEERFPQPVEAAAYFAVTHRLADTAAVRAAVSVRRDGDRLRTEIEDDGPPGDLMPIEDRVAALAGTLSVEPVAGSGTRIRVELPCGS